MILIGALWIILITLNPWRLASLEKGLGNATPGHGEYRIVRTSVQHFHYALTLDIYISGYLTFTNSAKFMYC